MKRSLLPTILLLIITLAACNRGYYSHVPRAKTKKTETVKHQNPPEYKQLLTEIEHNVEEHTVIVKNITTDTSGINNITVKPQANPAISKVVNKGKQVLSFYPKYKPYKKQKPNDGEIPNSVLVVLFIVALIAAAVILGGADAAGCGCLLAIVLVGVLIGYLISQ